eukprot:10306350-Lingulodinium_polyedra.AAC.1
MIGLVYRGDRTLNSSGPRGPRKARTTALPAQVHGSTGAASTGPRPYRPGSTGPRFHRSTGPRVHGRTGARVHGCT